MATTTPFVFRQGGPDRPNPQVVSGIATIDANETATLPIPCHGRGVVRIGFPTMTGTTATFTVQPFPPSDHTSPTLDPPFRPLYKNDGSAAVSVTVVDNSVIEVPQLSGCYAFTIVSGSSEASAREIEVQMVGEPAPFDPAGGVVASDFAAPALTLGTTNTAGNTNKVLATNSTILAFDATVPTTIAYSAAAAAGVATVTARRDHTHGMVAAPTTLNLTGLASKYKSATQTFSADTNFATVSAASGNFDFAIAASEVWYVRYVIPLTFTGTGGFKAQITGPASPTAVTIIPVIGLTTYDSAGSPIELTGFGSGVPLMRREAVVAAFSTGIAAHNAAGGTTVDTYNTTGGSTVIIEAVIANGANAGTITLQAAQNSANGTAVLGVGSFMLAQRLA